MLPQGRDTTEGKTSRGMPIGEAIKVSSLEYPMVKPLSLITQRRLIEHAAQSSSYASNSTITAFINSGDDWVAGKTSYLKFGIEWTTQAGNYDEYGSVVNVIDSISIYHSSGTLIDRVEAVNLKHCVWTNHTKNGDYLSNDALNYTYSATHAVDTTYTCAVPLGDLHGFWNTDKLIPAMLHSGLKVVIQLASNTIPNSGLAGGTFAVSDPVFVIDSLTLTDSAQLYLQEESAKNGLVFPFETYEHIDQATAASSSYNLSVFRAVSQATRAFAVARTTADITTDGNDSFLPLTAGADGKFSIQWKLGGNYFPVKSITTQADLYRINRDVVAYDTDKGCNLESGIGNGLTMSPMMTGVHMVKLERDHMLRHQGLPVSGSRSLNYTATLNSGSPVARTIDVFMMFIKLAKIFMYDKCIVSE